MIVFLSLKFYEFLDFLMQYAMSNINKIIAMEKCTKGDQQIIGEKKSLYPDYIPNLFHVRNSKLNNYSFLFP